MNKEKLIKVFEDTKKIVESTDTDSHSYKFNINNKSNDINHGVGNDVKVSVVNMDTVSAIVKYSGNRSVCALNMASAKKAGGGVRNGARAQEECLFRCSNLFETVVQSDYPLKEDEAIYTLEALFFKDKDYNQMDPTISDVITIPAINLNSSKEYSPSEYRKLTMDKMRAMLVEASNSCVNVLILGAWGCGVFGNQPEIMANMFAEVIESNNYELSKGFDKIVFAIINDHNSVDSNYEIFKRVLDGTGK